MRANTARTVAVVTKAATLGLAIFVTAAWIADADARGRLGGGGFSRGGPASHGGFSARPSFRGGQRQMGQRQLGDRQRGGSGRPSQIGGSAPRGQFGDQGISGGSRDRDASREDIQAERQSRQEDRQEFAEESREDRQEALNDLQEDRQDFIEDELDDDWDGCCDDEEEAFVAGAIVGGVVGAAAASTTTTYITTLPCASSEIIVDGVTYYRCSSTWYQRSYSGSQIGYIVAQTPPGF